MTAYKIASVAICYNFIRRDLSWNWISNLVVRLAIWTLVTESRKILGTLWQFQCYWSERQSARVSKIINDGVTQDAL